MLDITSVTCDEACYEADVKARDAIKVTAFREFMNIVSKERQGRIAELGAALCHQDSFEEGAKFYTQAMASGIDEPDLNEPFKVTCIAAAFQKASFN